MSSRTDDFVASAVVDRGLVSRAVVDDMRGLQRTLPGVRSIGELLVERGHLTAAQLARLLDEAVERLAQTATPRTKTPRAAEENAATRRAVDEVADPKKYVVEGEIARGGMGRILRAYDKRLRRPVAMKVIRDDHGLTADDLARFIEEAQATAQLEHPGIVPTHDVGLTPEGSLFFTMRLIHGRSLRDVIDKLSVGDAEALREFTLTRRLQILQQICYAVSYAHAKGVIHRDLKPENVMLGAFGEVLVMDWGLAKVIGRPERTPDAVRTVRTEDDASRTLEGMVAGTPAYMSPEQAEGRVDDVDERSDVYGIGSILYEMLTLRRPIGQKTNTSILLDVMEGRITPIEEALGGRLVPKELLAIVKKAMAKLQAERYATARALADAIQAFFEGRRGTAWSDTPFSLAIKWVSRHRALTSVSAVAAAALVVLSVWFYTRPGAVRIETDPPGADVAIDGVPVGRSPIRVDRLAAGRHRVEMTLDRHFPQEQPVSIGRGSETSFTFVLKSRFSVFRFASRPVAAHVTLFRENGSLERRFLAPDTAELPAGRYRLIAHAPGHGTIEREVVSPGGGSYELVDLELREEWAYLRADVKPEGATVVVVDARAGGEVTRFTASPDPRAKARIPSGPVRLRFERTNFFPVEVELSPRMDEQVRLSVSLLPMTAWSSPTGAVTAEQFALADVDGDGGPEIVACGTDVRLIGGDGELRWRLPLDRETAIILPPLVADVDGDGLDDVVVMDAEGRVQARCGRDAAALWPSSVQAATGDRLLVTGGMLVVLAHDRLSAYRLADGTPAWTRESDISDPQSLAAGRDGTLYAIDAETLTAIQPDDGETRQATMLDGRGIARRMHPAVFASRGGERLVHLESREEGSLAIRACGTDDGHTIWQAVLPGRDGALAVAAAESGTTVWCATDARRLLAFDGDTGVLLADLPLPGTPIGAPAPAWLDGDDIPDVAVALDGGAAGISGATRAVHWTYSLEGVSGEAMSADLARTGFSDVLLAKRDGTLVAVHGGRSPWQWRRNGFVAPVPPVLAESRSGPVALLATGRRELVVVELAGGRATPLPFPEGMEDIKAAAAGDLDGDGTVEAVLLDVRGAVALAGTKPPRWPELPRSGGGPVALRVVDDVDGDGVRDLLVGMSMSVTLRSGADGVAVWRGDADNLEAVERREGAAEVLVLDRASFRRLDLKTGAKLAGGAVAAHPPNASCIDAAGPRLLAYVATSDDVLVGYDESGREVTVLAGALRPWAITPVATPDGTALVVDAINRRPFVLWPHERRELELPLRGRVTSATPAPRAGELLVGMSTGRVARLDLARRGVAWSESLGGSAAVRVASLGSFAVAVSEAGAAGCVAVPRDPRPGRWSPGGRHGVAWRVFDGR